MSRIGQNGPGKSLRNRLDRLQSPYMFRRRYPNRLAKHRAKRRVAVITQALRNPRAGLSLRKPNLCLQQQQLRPPLLKAHLQLCPKQTRQRAAAHLAAGRPILHITRQRRPPLHRTADVPQPRLPWRWQMQRKRSRQAKLATDQRGNVRASTFRRISPPLA